LVERGWAGNDAIQHVRAVRPRAVETRAQERYVRDATNRIIPRDRE
jgi:protein-tyrosine phosphatase